MSAPTRVAAINLGMQTVTLAVFERAGADGLTLTAYARNGLLADPAADGSRPGQLKIALTELKSAVGWKNGAVRYAKNSR